MKDIPYSFDAEPAAAARSRRLQRFCRARQTHKQASMWTSRDLMHLQGRARLFSATARHSACQCTLSTHALPAPDEYCAASEQRKPRMPSKKRSAAQQPTNCLVQAGRGGILRRAVWRSWQACNTCRLAQSPLSPHRMGIMPATQRALPCLMLCACPACRALLVFFQQAVFSAIYAFLPAPCPPRPFMP